MDNRPIGIFDSGLGGLTVLKEIMALMPNESTVYFGDTGRMPYGTKSKETVIKYSLQNIRFLMGQDIKIIVIACNTASAYSLQMIKNNFELPVIEVIKPGTIAGIKSTKNKRIGVIGTNATIGSGEYEKAIKKIDSSVKVFSKSCPLFVPLVEEGPEWWEDDITRQIANRYLTPLKQAQIDTLILGCTHYPLLKNIISQVMGDEISLVSSAQEAARTVKNLIEKNNIMRDISIDPIYRYFTSDSIDKFEPLCSVILNRSVNCAEKIHIEKY